MMWRVAPALVVLAALALAAWFPGMLPHVFAHQDKLHHALGFMGLAVALRFAFPGRSPVDAGCAALFAAAGIELGQLFVPERTPSLLDFVASVAGAGVGLGLAALGRLRATDGMGPAHGAGVVDREQL
jgi:VanZ family protein